MRLRTALTALALTAALTACGSDGDSTPDKPAPGATAPSDEAAGNDTPEEPEATADRDLAVGHTYTYKDGLEVTVTAIRAMKDADYDEYAERPKGATPFVVEWKLNNGSSQPVDLDAWGYNAKGATTGGETDMVSLADRKDMTGRLAPGNEAQFNFGYALAEEHGTEVLFTLTRMDDQADWSIDDPQWIGAIG